MTGWNDLPYELIYQILSEASTQELLVASILNKYIHEVVTAVLYRTICLTNYRISLLLRTLIQNRDLVRHIRHTDLTWNGHRDEHLFYRDPQVLSSLPLQLFARKYFPLYSDPMDGMRQLWREHADAAAITEYSDQLKSSLLRGSESAKIVLILMYMENLESLTVKPPVNSTLFNQMTYDLFATGKFLTGLRSYTRIGTRELEQPLMRVIVFPVMLSKTIRKVQLGPGPVFALRGGEDSIAYWKGKAGESTVESLSIHGCSFEPEALSTLVAFPKALRSFTYNLSFMATSTSKVPFTMKELRTALSSHAQTLNTLTLAVPSKPSVQVDAETFGRLVSLRHFIALEELEAPIDVLLGVVHGDWPSGLFIQQVLPPSLVSLIITPPAFRGGDHFIPLPAYSMPLSDEKCQKTLLNGIGNARTHCPNLKTITCRCFYDPVVAENFLVSTLSLGIDVTCET